MKGSTMELLGPDGRNWTKTDKSTADECFAITSDGEEVEISNTRNWTGEGVGPTIATTLETLRALVRDIRDDTNGIYDMPEDVSPVSIEPEGTL